MAACRPDPCPPALRAMCDVLVEAVVATLMAEAKQETAQPKHADTVPESKVAA